MKRLNYAKRLHGPTGDIMRVVFQQTLAPSLAMGFSQNFETGAVSESSSIRQAFGETAVGLNSQRQLITSLSISSPSVLVALLTFGAMFETDLLLIDLSRPDAPIVCSFERAKADETSDEAPCCPLVLWVGRAGQVALVPGPAEIPGENTWPASILLNAGRIEEAADHPFADESDRLAGIERAIVTIATATALARNGRSPSPLPGAIR